MNGARDPVTKKPPTLSFSHAMAIVFLPFACGYFFSYFFRSVNAVIAPNLISEVGLNASQLGLLSAAYFFTFASSQIPLGVLLDRFGPRRVQGSLYCLAGVGALLFSVSDGIVTLMLSRGLIGIGVSGGLMGALKAIAQWFPKERYALVNGLYFVAGAVGALAATAPLEMALNLMDWRELFVILAFATAAAGAGIFFTVPDKPRSEAAKNLREQIQEIGKIYGDSFFWKVVPLMFTCSSANMAIQGLWAAPWLTDVIGLGRAEVANHLFILAVFMLIGAPFSGAAATALQRVGLSLSNFCALGALWNILSLLLIAFQVLESSYFLWAFFGFFGIQTSLAFAALAQHFPETVVGRASTAANVLVFGMAFLYQFGMGSIIELWPANADGSYPLNAYRAAYLAVIATQATALGWFLLPWKKY